MTISADYAPNIDLGNGTTLAFAVTFPFAHPADLLVTLFDTTTNENRTPPSALNGTAVYDYTVTGTPEPGTGVYPNATVTFNTAPPANTKVVRARVTPQFQEVVLIDNARFPAKAVEGGLDHLELQIQEMDSRLSRAIVAPVSDGPVNLVLPPEEVRADTVLTFDDAGNIESPGLAVGPIEAATAAFLAGVSPAPATAGWAATLAAALVLYPVAVTVANGQAMVVAARNVVADGYEGTFIYKAGDAATTFPQSGRGFVDAAGRRWFRLQSAVLVSALWYGAKGDGVTDDWAALDACWQDAIGHGQSGVFVPVGTYRLSRSLNINNASLIGASEVGTVFQPLSSFTGDSVLYLDSTRAGGGGTDARYTNFRILGNSAATSVAGLKLTGNVIYNTFLNIRIQESTGAGVLVDGTPGLKPNLNTFINVHVDVSATHGWHVKAGANMSLIDCASENVLGKGMYFSGENDNLSKIGIVRPYIENVAGDGIFLGNGDEFRVISPLVNGYGSNAAAAFGYRIDGSIATYQTFLYGGQFTKNPTLFLRDRTRTTDGFAHVDSRDFRFASGDAHIAENVYMQPGQLQILGNNTVQIRGNRSSGARSSYPMVFTNGGGVLAAGTTTFLGAWSGAQSLAESDVREYVMGYVTLSGMRAEASSLPGPSLQYQVQIFVDTNPTPFLLVLTDPAVVQVDIASELLVAPTSSITCRVLVDAGAAPIPQNGLHVTVGMRA